MAVMTKEDLRHRLDALGYNSLLRIAKRIITNSVDALVEHISTQDKEILFNNFKLNPEGKTKTSAIIQNLNLNYINVSTDKRQYINVLYNYFVYASNIKQGVYACCERMMKINYYEVAYALRAESEYLFSRRKNAVRIPLMMRSDEELFMLATLAYRRCILDVQPHLSVATIAYMMESSYGINESQHVQKLYWSTIPTSPIFKEITLLYRFYINDGILNSSSTASLIIDYGLMNNDFLLEHKIC